MTGVRAIAVIPLRARNRLYRPFENFEPDPARASPRSHRQPYATAYEVTPHRGSCPRLPQHKTLPKQKEESSMSITVEKPESAGMSASRLERIAPAMQAYIDRGTYAGITTLVARRGRIVHARQFGLRDKEARAPMAEDTIFRLYSMTKPIVCTALMALWEEGRCTLFDPLAKYIPSFGRVKVLGADGTLVDPVRPIRLGDLMAHTSGLGYHFLEEFRVGRMYGESKILGADCPLEEGIEDIAPRLPAGVTLAL
jgi:CubicO group peptidase (beta-lactamase class C family)